MIPSLSFASCVDRLGWVLVHSLWQFVLLTLGALVLQRALHRCSAVARYWALLVMMCAMALAPVATWSLLPAEPPAAATPVVAGRGRRRFSPHRPVPNRKPDTPPPIVAPQPRAGIAEVGS